VSPPSLVSDGLKIPTQRFSTRGRRRQQRCDEEPERGDEPSREHDEDEVMVPSQGPE